MNNLITDIQRMRSELKGLVTIPAHHYEDNKIIRVADFVGDSHKLAVECSRKKTEYIVFCGVRFMAESAFLLKKQEQKILIPETSAGCPLADMIDIDRAEPIYKKILSDRKQQVVPVVYVNSNADMKSFCGRNGGATCTSSNAAKIVSYFLQENKAVLFAPDLNLGVNTARRLGIRDEDMVIIKKDLNFIGDYRKAKLFLWDGFCYVHKKFRVSDIDSLREKYQGIRIIVHPECDEAVVKASGLSGSTETIYQTIKESPPNSVWGVGTELHFVQRIASEFHDKTIVPIIESSCSDMSKITLEKLARSLRSIISHRKYGEKLINEVKVEPAYIQDARKALQKMITITEGR